MKSEAAKLVGQSMWDQATDKYFQAINIVRLNSELKTSKDGKTLELACRSNIAHCKLQLKDYVSVMEQCEKVLE